MEEHGTFCPCIKTTPLLSVELRNTNKRNVHGPFLCIAAIYTDHESEWHGALHMYRGFFLVFLAMFLVGINTYGWRSCGVNHVLIFELDPRDHLTHQNFLEVWTSNVLVFLGWFLINYLCLLSVCPSTKLFFNFWFETAYVWNVEAKCRLFTIILYMQNIVKIVLCQL